MLFSHPFIVLVSWVSRMLVPSLQIVHILHSCCFLGQVINENGYDGAAADVWSCGIILYVLLAGFLPFDEYNTMELYKKVLLTLLVPLSLSSG